MKSTLTQAAPWFSAPGRWLSAMSGIWDYFPHPKEHPRWFLAFVFMGFLFFAAFGSEEAHRQFDELWQILIGVAGVGFLFAFLWLFIRGVAEVISGDGFGAIVARLWLCLSLAWFALAYYVWTSDGRTPHGEEAFASVLPLIAGPVTWRVGRWILGGW